MKLLLDTHTFLWFIGGDAAPSTRARNLIEDPANQPFVSTASSSEMAIKLSLGKLSLGQPFEALIPAQMSLNGIDLLGIEITHLAVVATLPFQHGDPFDRLLVAQSIAEQMPIISGDRVFDLYPIQRSW